jgi:hypothetical protein
VIALVLSGCAVPVEQHGGLAPRPAAPDVVFLAAGAGVETLAVVTRRTWWQQLAVVGALSWWVRVPEAGGRTEAAHLLVIAGAFPVKWAQVALSGHP